MITEENFLNLVKITNNINENNMPPSEYTWFFRGAKLAWLFYNIVEKSHNKNDKIKIEYLVNKYNAVNCLIADYAKVNEPNLKKIMQEYIISLPGIKFDSEKNEFQPIQKNTKENYQWVLMYARKILIKLNKELEKIKIYEELIKNNNGINKINKKIKV